MLRWLTSTFVFLFFGLVPQICLAQKWQYREYKPPAIFETSSIIIDTRPIPQRIWEGILENDLFHPDRWIDRNKLYFPLIIPPNPPRES